MGVIDAPHKVRGTKKRLNDNVDRSRTAVRETERAGGYRRPAQFSSTDDFEGLRVAGDQSPGLRNPEPIWRDLGDIRIAAQHFAKRCARDQNAAHAVPSQFQDAIWEKIRAWKDTGPAASHGAAGD